MQSQYTSLIKHGQVVMFSKTYCPFCVQAKQMLDKLEVAYQAIEVDQLGSKYTTADKQQVDQMAGITTYPKNFVGTHCVGGCSELRVAIANGSFQQLLVQNGIKFKE